MGKKVWLYNHFIKQRVHGLAVFPYKYGGNDLILVSKNMSNNVQVEYNGVNNKLYVYVDPDIDEYGCYVDIQTFVIDEFEDENDIMYWRTLENVLRDDFYGKYKILWQREKTPEVILYE